MPPVDFFLERAKPPSVAWDPICDLVNEVLLSLGLTPNPESKFRVLAHTTRKKEPTGSLFMMQMHLAHLYTVDTEGWGVDDSRMESSLWQEGSNPPATEFCQKLAAQWMVTGRSKLIQPRMAALPAVPEWEDYVLVPMQIPQDSVIVDHSPVSVQEFVAKVAAWARESQTRVLLKVHPGYKLRGEEAFNWAADAAKDNPFVRVSTGNIHYLIHHAKAVLVINSGTGFEALVHGRPVITIGRCDYAPATVQCFLGGLSGGLESALIRPVSTGYLFAHHYIHQHCYWLGRDATVKARMTDYLRRVVQGL